MNHMLNTIDRSLPIVRVLAMYWAGFWLLNGGDKFFNGTYFYGVTRDDAFAEYFSRLGLSASLASDVLYSVSVFEVILGLFFVVMIFYPTMKLALNRLSFKLSLLLFTFFCMGDTLFGDRIELLEHSTYIGVVLISYWLALTSEEAAVQAPENAREAERPAAQFGPSPSMSKR